MGTKLRILTAAAALTALAACTVNKADKAPSLTGPSDNSTSLQLQITPDTIFQDGASQALVTITAIGPDGSPARNLSLLTQISVGGSTTDFGRLSARSLVTDANGKATVTYTAPPAPPIANADGTIVGISVTPLGTDFANSMTRTVTVRLVPTGVIGAPPSSLRTTINLPTSATVGDTAVFTASITDSAGVDASSQVASFQWNFGDGSTATGRTASHTYSQPGNYAVSLTIVDALGRVGGTTQSITVGGGTNPTATFFTTPSSPNVGQQITFNASQALAAPGHSITSYAWDFGDGSTAGGVQTTHAYLAAGSYTVILVTTDDVGRKGTLTQTISVGAAGLTADFNFSPSSPAVGQSVSFDASTSKASTGRTISSYAWNFDDGTTGSGAQTSKSYDRTGTFNVRLTVTDDLGQSQSVTKAVTVGGSGPTAAFTFSPTSPRRGQAVSFNASSSRAGTGRTITQYAWNFDDGDIAFGVTAPHAFTNNGTFNVRLTVTDDIGQTNSVTQAVTVSDANPTASFTFSPSTPATGQTVQFDASASRPVPGRTITAYAWNFDDGTTGTGVSPTKVFTVARTYLVRLTVTDDFGQTATTSNNVTVGGSTPTAGFTFSPSAPVRGQVVSFDASSSRAATGRTITQYAWNFDDGSTASGVTTQHAFNNTGTFNVRLTITDDIGQTNTATLPVTVGGADPTASFIFSPTSPSPNQPVSFDASASRAANGRTIASYLWNFDDGTTGTGRTTTHAFVQPRTYNVRLTVTDDLGATGTIVQSVTTTNAPPTASFTFLPPTPDVNQPVTFDASASQVAAGSGRTIVSYSWNFGDGTTGTGVQTTHPFTTANTYTVILTVTDSAGQTATTSRTVPVASNGPVAVFTFTPNSPVPRDVNGNATVTFNASASRAGANATINRYQWQFLGTPNTDGQCAAPILPGGPGAPGGPIVTTQNPIQDNTYTSPGTRCVFLTIFDNNGGSSQAIRLITIQ